MTTRTVFSEGAGYWHTDKIYKMKPWEIRDHKVLGYRLSRKPDFSSSMQNRSNWVIQYEKFVDELNTPETIHEIVHVYHNSLEHKIARLWAEWFLESYPANKNRLEIAWILAECMAQEEVESKDGGSAPGHSEAVADSMVQRLFNEYRVDEDAGKRMVKELIRTCPYNLR